MCRPNQRAGASCAWTATGVLNVFMQVLRSARLLASLAGTGRMIQYYGSIC